MKTIREHLESIADTELREASLRNCDKEYENEEVLRIDQAIGAAFIWHKTKEGSRFWLKIQDFYEHGKQPTYSQFKHLIK